MGQKTGVLGNIAWYSFLTIIGLLMVLPFYWTIMTSLKPNSEIFDQASFWFPRMFTMEHYVSVFTQFPFPRYFLNSAYLASAGVLTNLFLGSLAGYSFAKLFFRGRKVIFAVLLSSMMIPGIVNLVPSFLIIRSLGMVNSYWAIILPGAVGAFAVFFMKQFFQSLPAEMGEAARIDGCPEFRLFWQIYLPLTKPALATLGIMTFQGGWNNFMWPLIVLNDELRMPLQVGLARFAFNNGSDIGPLMAGAVITALPMLVIFMFAQKYFVKGIAFSGNSN